MMLPMQGAAWALFCPAGQRLASATGAITSSGVGVHSNSRGFASKPPPDFHYQEILEMAKPKVPYRKLTGDYVSTISVAGKEILQVKPEALTRLAREAMVDIAHLLRPAHLQQLRNILDDKEASNNDRFVAMELLKNANVAAGMVLPGCQDTGTATVMGKKGQFVWTDEKDEESLSKGVFKAYTETNLR